jgi:hypothetical protein
LRDGLERDDQAAIAEAYELWGFKGLKREIIDAMNVWSRFLYAPLLDRRVRKVADGIEPGEYGRREIMEMKRKLMQYEAVTIPREFVLLDRAVIGLGAAFLRLKAELNFADLFDECMQGFTVESVEARQRAALERAGLTPRA